MPELISSVSQLLWPLIALMALFVFRRAIGRVLRTAERRELEFEVGGQKLTMHELNDQQNELIQDLQRQLSILSKRLDQFERGVPAPAGTSEEIEPGMIQPGVPPLQGALPDQERELPAVRAPVGAEPFAVLWVSERAENHALLVEQLRDNGVRVTMVSTTAEALTEVSKRAYRLIVSDMSRKENGHYRPDAGLALLRELRDLGVEIPVIVFSGSHGQLRYGPQARQSGAVATTSSAYEMFQHFQNFGLL
jgi:CheY-like chemotaxis protein/uncharacterized coiled-coil protein SlyX